MPTEPTPYSGPLTAVHLDQINAAIAQLDEAQRQIDLAKRAGINVDAQEMQVTQHLASLRRIRSVYFPNA